MFLEKFWMGLGHAFSELTPGVSRPRQRIMAEAIRPARHGLTPEQAEQATEYAISCHSTGIYASLPAGRIARCAVVTGEGGTRPARLYLTRLPRPAGLSRRRIAAAASTLKAEHTGNRSPAR
jgi:hypothetical protein